MYVCVRMCVCVCDTTIDSSMHKFIVKPLCDLNFCILCQCDSRITHHHSQFVFVFRKKMRQNVRSRSTHIVFHQSVFCHFQQFFFSWVSFPWDLFFFSVASIARWILNSDGHKWHAHRSHRQNGKCEKIIISLALRQSTGHKRKQIVNEIDFISTIHWHDGNDNDDRCRANIIYWKRFLCA